MAGQGSIYLNNNMYLVDIGYYEAGRDYTKGTLDLSYMDSACSIYADASGGDYSDQTVSSGSSLVMDSMDIVNPSCTSATISYTYDDCSGGTLTGLNIADPSTPIFSTTPSL
jgi:hypothetical protein